MIRVVVIALTPLLLVASIVNWMAGAPIRTSHTPVVTIIESVDEVFNEDIRGVYVVIAEALDEFGLPSGRMAQAPIYYKQSELGFLDALVNIWTAVSFGFLSIILSVVMGAVLFVKSLIAVKILAALGWLAMMFFGPLIFGLFPGAILTTLIFYESSILYTVAILPFALVSWLGGFVVGLGFLAFVFAVVSNPKSAVDAVVVFIFRR